MPLKLGMLGMWHTHADGIVRQVADHADEFTLAGFWDPDPKVAADRSRKWQARVKDLRVFDDPDKLRRFASFVNAPEARIARASAVFAASEKKRAAT